VRGFFLGFPDREVQSVLSFLKGKTSSFSPIFAVCVDTAMSRQDNFFLLVKVCSISWLYVYFFVGISEHWIFFYPAVL
jgi:hypothetical protein